MEEKICLIIPALNEAPSIGQVLDSLPPGLFSCVIVADNGSTDRTAEIAAARGVTVVRESRRGYGRACMAGMAALPPDCTVVVFMDADASDDPSDTQKLLEPILRQEADLVVGARRSTERNQSVMPLHQRLGNTLAIHLIRLLFRFRYSDLGPFRAIRSHKLQLLAMQDPTYGWTVEMQVKALLRGLRVREVPVNYRLRIGSSKISGNLRASIAAGVKILWTIARLAVARH
ncbi:MAG: glycosyltransferase [Acidobacteria bacterium]|nr:glycosyltransferase [Acidobacteriota bacterium]